MNFLLKFIDVSKTKRCWCMFGKVKNALHMAIECEQGDLANETGIKSEGLFPQPKPFIFKCLWRNMSKEFCTNNSFDIA